MSTIAASLFLTAAAPAVVRPSRVRRGAGNPPGRVVRVAATASGRASWPTAVPGLSSSRVAAVPLCKRPNTRVVTVTTHAADATAGDAPVTVADADPKKASAFVVGILWFFGHQLIGVGNDVIMKYTGTCRLAGSSRRTQPAKPETRKPRRLTSRFFPGNRTRFCTATSPASRSVDTSRA